MSMRIAKLSQSCFFAWIITAVLLPQTSFAQFGWWQKLEPMTSRESLRESLKTLEVEDSNIIWILYDNMALIFVQEAAAFEESMIKGKGDDALTIWKRNKAWNDSRLSYQLQFEQDIALTLDDNQKVLWLKLTRSFRRDRVIPEMSFHAGHGVLLDLLVVLDSLDLNDNELDGLKDIRKSYEESLDLLLIAWEKHFGEIYAELFRLQLLIKAKDKKAKESRKQEMARLDKLAADVREFNNSIDIEMASFLEPDHMQEFQNKVTSRDFPGLFVASLVDLTAKRLKTFEGITDEQRGVIQAIHAEYKLKRITDRQKMIIDIRHWNSQKQTAKRFARLDVFLKERMTRKEAVKIFATEHVAIPHVKRLRTYEKQVCQAIRDLFSSEQFNDLPAEVRLYLSLWN